MKNLKHKQFCDEYLSNGMNARLAYMSVYKSVKSEAGADASASKLLTNPKLQDYIKTQQDKSATKLGITKEDLIKDLIDIKDNTKKKSPTIAIKAIETLNKMNGFNDPDKQDITTNGESINPIAINVNIIKPKKDGK